MRARWESLRFPHLDGKIDWVAVDLAINDLKIKRVVLAPYDYRDNPSASVVTSSSKNPFLIPHVEQWVQRGIVTGDLSVIPKIIHFNRLLCHQKEWRDSPDSRPSISQYFHFDSSVKDGVNVFFPSTPGQQICWCG